ncbi:MAG TPA: hypothetical protein VL026_04270 [Rhizomicrobium sp.]|nr:hypothetical protein [Rhizomicrobium sp.]
MTRLGLAGSFTVLLLASASPAFAAGEDTADAVLSACGERSLPRDMVSTCLERARLVNDQAPSPALRDLQARLEQRVRTEPSNDLMPAPSQAQGRVTSQPLPDNGAAMPAPAQPGQYAPPPYQGPPAVNDQDGNGDQGYDDDGSGDGNDNGSAGPPPPPPPDMSQPYDDQQAAPYDDSDEPPIEGEDDGYDNSLPDPSYDAPDPPDPDWPPPGGGYDDGTSD